MVSKASAAVPKFLFGIWLWPGPSQLPEHFKVKELCWLWGPSSGAPHNVLCCLSWTLTAICFCCGTCAAAVPAAEFTPGSGAMEVTVLQNVQCVVEGSVGKSNMLITPAGDGNHVRTGMFGIFHFRHSNIGSSDLSHWDCRASLDCPCCPAPVKLQNVLSMYILYVRCFSSLLDSCPVTPGIVPCKGLQC